MKLKLNLKKELDCNFVDSDNEELDEDDNKYSDDLSKNFKNEMKPEVNFNFEKVFVKNFIEIESV